MQLNNRFVVDLQKAKRDSAIESGLAATISELYMANHLNYSFPEAEILRLGEQVRTIYEEGPDFRIHANLRRATQPGEPVVSATA